MSHRVISLGLLATRDYPQATFTGFVRIPGQPMSQGLGSLTCSPRPPGSSCTPWEAAAPPCQRSAGFLRHHILVKSMMRVPGLWPGGSAQACGTGRQFTSTVTHRKVSGKCKGANGQDRRPFSLTSRALIPGWDRPAQPVLTTVVKGNPRTFL